MSTRPLNHQPWAITESGLQIVLAVASRGELYPEVLERARADFGDGEMDNAPPSLRVRNGTALIPVRGPLFRHAGLMSALSGATSYDAIGRCLDAALADGQVQRIALVIDSQGGEVAGCAELAARIRAASKPVVAYAEGTCASAAYWLACAAREVVAARTAELGSIGVQVALTDTSKAQEQAGVRRVEIVSSQSPGKRGSPIDDEVLARVQARVDDLAAIFVSDVARYRNTSEDKVLADFGQGDVMIGQKAVAQGLADRLGSLDDVLDDVLARTTQEKKMTEKRDLSARLAALRETDPELAAHIEQQQAAAASAEAKRIAAEATAEQVRYEDLIRAGKADAGEHGRKITSPDQEVRVRAAYPKAEQLERFLRATEPAPALKPEKPPGDVGATAADQAEVPRYVDLINRTIKSQDLPLKQITASDFAAARAKSDRALPRVVEE